MNTEFEVIEQLMEHVGECGRKQNPPAPAESELLIGETEGANDQTALKSAIKSQ